MSQIPSPIIALILLNLPTKSLVRFRCVSKLWKNTIDDPYFINQHLQKSKQDTSLNHSLIIRRTHLNTVEFPTLDHATELDHPLKPPTYSTEILGSCNGLLCLSNPHVKDDDGGGGGTIIYNPITKKQRGVAFSPVEFPNVDYFTGVDRMVYGFGFDHVENDYKLVRVIQFFGKHGGYDSEVKVYSIKNESWRRVCDFPRGYYLSYKVKGVLVNGCFHWVVNESSDFDEFEDVEPNMRKKLIVAFDLVLEEFRVVEPPEYYELSGNLHVDVGSLNGCLYWMCNYYRVNVDVWVMKEYGVKESWTKKFSIAQPGVLGYSFEYFLPIMLSKDGSNVLLHKNGDCFVWFDMKKNRVKSVDVQGMPTNAEAQVLVESLVLGSRRTIRKKKVLSKKGSLEMAGFSTQLITKILSRLPVKSLLRFRSVSKSWRSIIDDSHFIDLHLKQSLQSTTNHTLIIRSCYLYSVDFPTLSRATEIDHPLKSPSFGTQILGSCNGLLCLSNSHENDRGGTIICNPTTKNQCQVPVSRIQFHNYFTRCDRMVYGFGYDSVNDDYKLVRIVQCLDTKSGAYDSEVKVYSLKTDSWRRVRDFPRNYHLSYKRTNGVYVNGCFHWVANLVSVVKSRVYGILFGSYSDESVGEYESKLIVAFDLGSEQVKVVPQPEYPESINLHVNVGNLRGCLYLMCNYHKVCTDVWVMEEYGVKESWSKKFSISQPGILGSFEYVLPIAFSKDGSNVLLLKDGKCFVWFDMQRQRAESVHLDGLSDIAEVQVLVESLVPASKRNNKSKRNRDDIAGCSTNLGLMNSMGKYKRF